MEIIFLPYREVQVLHQKTILHFYSSLHVHSDSHIHHTVHLPFTFSHLKYHCQRFILWVRCYFGYFFGPQEVLLLYCLHLTLFHHHSQSFCPFIILLVSSFKLLFVFQVLINYPHLSSVRFILHLFREILKHFSAYLHIFAVLSHH